MQPPYVTARRWVVPGALALLAAAVMPLFGPIDAALDGMLDGWRSCAGMSLATMVSNLVEPVGVSVLTVAVLRALWLGRPRPVEIAGIVAALVAGVVLIGELKELLDRPRPGAEFLGPTGASFPSGHVGNTVLNGLAVLALWSVRGPRGPGLVPGRPRGSGRPPGGAANRPRWRGWLVLAAAVLVVAFARVYGRRHWPSDALGTAAVALAYGMIALLHPDARWRTGVTAAAVAAIGLVHAAAASGLRVGIPAGTVAGRRLPVGRVAFDSAYERGLLRGSWAPDTGDARRSVWLRSATGELVIGPVDTAVSEVRLVLRPRFDPAGVVSCRRLRVALNGRMLGEPVVQAGWKSYMFPTTAADFRPDANVLSIEVRREPSESRDGGERRAAFREVTLHSATAPAALRRAQSNRGGRRAFLVRRIREPPAARPTPPRPGRAAASAASCRH
jgi:membrane-associated phospholipid phosphatase